MSILASLFRSLYSLTRLSFFNDIANSLYKVERTKNRVKQVGNNVKRVQDQNKKNKVS